MAKSPKRGKTPKFTKSSLELQKSEHAYQLKSQLIGLAKTGIIATCILFVVKELSGKDTFAFFFVEIITDDDFTQKIAIASAVIALLWASLERWYRFRKVAELSARIRYLEAQQDPNRTSSEIPESGKSPES